MKNMLGNWKLPCFHFLRIYHYQAIHIHLFAASFIHWNESSTGQGHISYSLLYTQHLKKCLAHRQAISIS